MVVSPQEKARELAMWEKRNQTIAVLATATLVFARLRFTEHTVLTHLSTLLGTLFAAGVAYVQLAPKLFPSLPSPPSEEPDVTLSEQYMRKLIDSSLPRANRTLVFLFQASRFHEMADLTKAAGITGSLFAMYFVGKFISLLSLVYVATIVFLTLPKVYKMHQSTIDQNLHQVKEQASSTVQRTISRVSSQSSAAPSNGGGAGVSHADSEASAASDETSSTAQGPSKKAQ